MKYASDKAYQAVMKIKVIEQIRTLKQNYDASQRYYKEYQRLNSGKGFLHNVGDQIARGGNQIYDQLQTQIDRDFLNTYVDSDVDRMFRATDRKIRSTLKYAVDATLAAAKNRGKGVAIAEGANGLTPKAAANLSAKADGLQLQLLQQIHEDNLLLIELRTMDLAIKVQNKRRQRALLENIRRGAKKRVPGLENRARLPGFGRTEER